MTLDVEYDHPRYHENNTSCDGQDVNSKKYGVQQRNVSRHHMREEKIKHGLPEKNDHDGNPDG